MLLPSFPLLLCTLHGLAYHLPCSPAGTRDHVHQLSVLNVASGQLLSLLLRACPGVMHSAAAEVGCSAVQPTAWPA